MPSQPSKGNSSLKADELLDLLKADISLNDVPQSGEVDEKVGGQGLGTAWARTLPACGRAACSHAGGGLMRGTDPEQLWRVGACGLPWTASACWVAELLGY